MRSQKIQEAWLFFNHICAMLGMDCINSIAVADCDKQISFNDLRAALRKITAFKMDGKWQIAPIKSNMIRVLKKLNVSINNEELASALETCSKL